MGPVAKTELPPVTVSETEWGVAGTAYRTVPPVPKFTDEPSVPVKVRVFDRVMVLPAAGARVAWLAGFVIATLDWLNVVPFEAYQGRKGVLPVLTVPEAVVQPTVVVFWFASVQIVAPVPLTVPASWKAVEFPTLFAVGTACGMIAVLMLAGEKVRSAGTTMAKKIRAGCLQILQRIFYSVP